MSRLSEREDAPAGDAGAVAHQADGEAFLSALLAAADQAEERAGGPVCATFRLAGQVVRLRGAGTSLLDRLGPAIAHRRVADDEPAALTIRLVDTATAHTSPPRPSWRWDNHLPRGQVPGFANGPVRLAYEAGWRGISALSTATATATGVFWIRDAVALPSWEVAAPLRTLLHWWLPAHGTRLVHGAAVGVPGAAALFVGPGGSGKSTTALACMEDGLSYLGDDYVAVSASAAAWKVHNLYATAKLVPDHLRARLPRLSDLVAHEVGDTLTDKQMLLLGAAELARVSAKLPLRLVVVPVLHHDGETHLRPLTPAAALRAVGPSTIFQQPGDEHSSFEFLSRLVRDLPTAALHLGPDLDEVPTVVRRALEGLAS